MTVRKYSSPLRAAEAARTRGRILDAAASLFSRDGYAATTMKGIALEAGVSVQSVHLAGSKAELLIGSFERTFAGDEGRHSLSERPAMTEIMADPDPRSALGRWLDYVADANRRSAGLARAMVTAAETDQVAASAVADLDERRRSDMSIAARWAVERGLLSQAAAGMAADELGFLTGPEAYAYLVVRTGWPVERYRAWLDRSLDDLVASWQSDSGPRSERP